MRLYVCRAYTYHWASCLCATRTICHCQSISLDSGHGPGFTDCHDRWYSSARAYPREPRASAFTLGKGSKSVCLGSTHRDVENRGLEAPRNGPTRGSKKDKRLNALPRHAQIQFRSRAHASVFKFGTTGSMECQRSDSSITTAIRMEYAYPAETSHGLMDLSATPRLD